MGQRNRTILPQRETRSSAQGDREDAADVSAAGVWFNLSDEGTEAAIYDSYAMQKFVGINFLEEDAPDATTLLKIHRLIEQHGINKLFFEAINRVMVESMHMLKGGTVVDATIINASPPTKNAGKQQDPEMHQTKKGNEWRFGMKCHLELMLSVVLCTR